MNIKDKATLWYQKGYLQKVLVFIVYLMVMTVAMGIMDFFFDLFAFGKLDTVLSNHFDDPTKIALVKQEIAQHRFGMGFLLFAYLGAVLLGGMWIVKRFTLLNIVAPVTLDNAVRFNDAMESLGLLHSSEQVLFLQSNKLPLYIAEQPMTSSEAENVKAKPYVFAHNALSSQDFLERQAGQRRLCVKADELQSAIDSLYAALKLDNEPNDSETVKALQKKLIELEQEKRAVNGQLVTHADQIAALEVENKRIANELQGERMRAGKSSKSDRVLSLYSMIFAPVYQKLARGNHESRDFTRETLTDFFARELATNKILHEQLKIVTKRKSCNKPPSNVLDAIWENLKEFNLVSTGGAAPNGSRERLRRLFYPGSDR